MENEVISVIVPVYNMEQYLERCVCSILCQTYQKLEIILVDDGSTDASPKMCDAFAERDERIKVVHKENGGLSDARNAGLLAASGAYIGYVDSDDWIEPDMYEKMYRACVENDAQVCICRYFSEYADRTLDGASGACVPLTREALLRIYIGGHAQYVIYNSVWSKLFRRSLVEDMEFPKGRNSEDIVYTTKAFCRLERAVYLDECLYHYVLDREGSIMNVSRGERMFRDELPFWREHITLIRTLVSNELGDFAAYYFWRRLLFYYIDFWNAQRAGDRTAKEYAQRIAGEIRRDREEIRRVYHSGSVSKGDRVRMRMFLMSPSLYAFVVRLYEKFVIPIRG